MGMGVNVLVWWVFGAWSLCIVLCTGRAWGIWVVCFCLVVQWWVFTLCRGRLSSAWGGNEHIYQLCVYQLCIVCDGGLGWHVSIWGACFFLVGVSPCVSNVLWFTLYRGRLSCAWGRKERTPDH